MVREAIPSAGVDSRYYVESAARTVHLLMVLARASRPMSLRDLVAELGWSKPMVYRLVRTLEARGALRHADSRGYVLGPAMITVGQAALHAVELTTVARPHLERLHGELGETVNLTILDSDEVVYVDRVEDRQILGVRLNFGSRLPAYCTSMGHVQLAGLPDEEVRRRLAGCTFEPLGPNTIRSLPELLERLENVRAQGYAVNDEELAVGHRAAAAPVHDHVGRVVAAVNVSVPAARVSLAELDERLVPILVATTGAISAHLGWAAPAAVGAG